MTLTKFGINKREITRNNLEKKLLQELSSDLKLELHYLFKADKFDEDKFNKDRVKFFEKLKENKINKHIRALIHNEISDLVDSGNKEYEWNIKVPKRLSVYKQKPQPRNDKWFNQFVQLYDWVEAWNNHIRNEDINNSYEDIVAQLALSTIIFGGLAFEEGTISLINKLLLESRPLQECKGMYWCDLVIKSPKFPGNVIIEEKSVTVHRWFLDNLSLMWVYRFLKLQTPKEIIRKRELRKYIKNFIIKVAEKNVLNVKDILDLKKIYKISFGITELLPGVNFDQAHINYSRNHTSSISLRPDYWNSLLTNKYLKKKEKNQFHSETKKSSGSPKQNIDSFEESLKYAFKIKNSSSVVLKCLNKIQTDVNIEIYILDWLRFNLEERKNSVSTTSGYKGVITDLWLKARDEEIDPLNEQELEGYYNSVFFNEKKECIIKDYKQAIYHRFHRYCEITFGLPGVESFNNLRINQKTFVRAGFISGEIFIKFLNEYKIKSNDRQYFKKMMICIFILMYRTGLRIGEVIKLRISDIEISEEFWLVTRESSKGKNKTTPSLRRIPLGVILKNDEIDFLKSYISFKSRVERVNKSSLIFSMKFTPDSAISTQNIYRIFRRYFVEKYNLPNVIHLMRHTAISKLYAVIINNKKLLDIVSDYGNDETEKIQKKFNMLSKNKYWELAKFAGHSSPQTTFSTYIHFCDFQIYTELIKYQRVMKWREIEKISGSSRKFLAKWKKDLKLGKEGINLSEINKIFHKTLNKYSKSLKPFIKKDNYELDDFSKIEIQDADIWYILKEIEQIESIQSVKFENFEELTIKEYTKIIVLPLEKDLKETISSKIKEIAESLKIKEKTIVTWYENAKYLSGLKTNKKGSALFSNSKKIPPIGYHLAPTTPRSINEKKIVNAILDDYHSIWENQNDDFKNVLIYFINNYSKSEKDVVFSCPEKLNKFLGVISDFFTKKSIVIEYKTAKGKNIGPQLNKWKEAIKEKNTVNQMALFSRPKILENGKKKYPEVNKKHIYPIGIATLKTLYYKRKVKYLNDGSGKGKVDRFKEQQIVEISNTSNILKFTLHLISIRKLHLLDKNKIERV